MDAPGASTVETRCGLEKGTVVGSQWRGRCPEESESLGVIVIRGGPYTVIIRRITDTF